MKRRHLLFALPLLLPIFVFAFAHLKSGPPGADVMVSLSRDISRNPQKNVYIVHSYTNNSQRCLGWFFPNSISHYTSRYERSRREILTNDRRGGGATTHTNVYDNIIHAAARKNQGWDKLTQYGVAICIHCYVGADELNRPSYVPWGK